MTGFCQDEFDEFYTQTFWADVPPDDVQPVLLKRPWFFAEARNNLGEHSAEDNKQRRTIRGLLNDRDRVLCWLQMLRRDQQFGDMEAMYGPSKTMFHNDFKDMTAAAQNMPCLLMVSFSLFLDCDCDGGGVFLVWGADDVPVYSSTTAHTAVYYMDDINEWYYLPGRKDDHVCIADFVVVE